MVTELLASWSFPWLPIGVTNNTASRSIETGNTATRQFDSNHERLSAVWPVSIGPPQCSVIGDPLTNKRLKMTHAPLLIIFEWLNLVTNPRHFQYYKILKIFSRHKIFSKNLFYLILSHSAKFFIFHSGHPTSHSKNKKNYLFIYFCLFIFTMKSWKKGILVP